MLKQVINLEWGNFRSPYLPRTFADEEVDRDSVNPGDQVKVAFADSKLSIQNNLSLELFARGEERERERERERADGGWRLGCCCSGLRR